MTQSNFPTYSGQHLDPDTYLPMNQVHILAGASGAGKTTLIMQAVQAMQKGQPFPLPLHAGKIAYLASDRAKDEAEYRRDKLGVEMEVYGIVDDRSFKEELLEEPKKAFMHAVNEFKERDFKTLILDPLMLFVGGNTISYTEVARGLVFLSRYAAARGIQILATHHANKARTDFTFRRPQDRISGTSAFQAFSGTHLVLIQGSECKSEADWFYMIPHLAPPVAARLLRGQDGWFTAV